jgi:CO/xanthine dehydrogenase Mo-binding subunit
VLRPDTAIAQDAGSSVASRQTFVSGNALLQATGKIRKKLIDVAHRETGIPRKNLTLRRGFLYADGEKLPVRVVDLASKAFDETGKLSARGYYEVKFPAGTFDQASFSMAAGALTFGTQVAQVLVDLETGNVKVEDLWIVVDTGRIIHLNGAMGQVEGGAAMGFGQAVMEDLLVREGRTLNNSLESYLIPTSMDMPRMHIDLLENPSRMGPYGAKGIGEAAILPTAPAIVNAVCQAIGAPINSMPATAEKVLNAIKLKFVSQP